MRVQVQDDKGLVWTADGAWRPAREARTPHSRGWTAKRKRKCFPPLRVSAPIPRQLCNATLADVRCLSPVDSPPDLIIIPGPTEYFRLRTVHRLVGAMVGGLPGFRQQDTLHGLPLQLSPEEVTLAVESGWVELYEDSDEAATVERAGNGVKREAVGTAQQRQQQRPRHPTPKGWGAKPKHNAKKIRGGVPGGVGGGNGGGASGQSWDDMLKGSFVVLPLVDTDLAPSTSGSQGGVSGQRPPPRWTYPRTASERRRYAVFADLHRRGLTLTAGIKFGADYLAYPGDPMAYHACFTVRVCGEAEGLQPLALGAATRLSHAARKNLVLATAVSGERERDGGTEAGVMRVSYITVTPDVDQSSNRGYR